MFSLVSVCFRSTFQYSKILYKIIYIIYIFIFIYLCIMLHAWCLQARKDVGSPGTGVLDVCESPCVFLDLNPGSSGRGTCALICWTGTPAPILKSYRLFPTVVAPYVSFDLHRLRGRSEDRGKLRGGCIFLADLFALQVRCTEYLTCTLQHPSMCSTIVCCSLVSGHPVGRNKCGKAEKSRDCAILIN